MIIDVSRSHIKVELGGKTVTVPGEMFFPPNEKLGFAVYSNEIKFWDEPNEIIALTAQDINEVLDDIRQDFAKGGHTLEIE
ncbi:MAG: immunity 74 family protein [Methylococcaceae bacterium]|nr:immunity 74 family protein [Methylococcaceae bacterium]